MLDKDGNPAVLPIILDRHNHYCDAIRYACDTLIKKNPAGFFDLS